jgi:sn-1 stearoyl-lipid 9-desaturase
MTIATSTKLQINWVNTLFFAALHIGALFALVPSNFSWSAVGVGLLLYWITGGLGITLGFHRLVTHRSFQTPKWLEYLLVLFGTLACQGGPIEWVGTHRIHHLHSDTEQDPHDSNKGFWWSHMGWLIYHAPAHAEVPRFTKDIADDPVYHCTWLVNSATHKFGYRSYEAGDRSTNCWWVALLVFGEGWHNNHHAFQYSARHGLEWWEIDMTWMTVQLLQALGLATNVKLADKKS